MRSWSLFWEAVHLSSFLFSLSWPKRQVLRATSTSVSSPPRRSMCPGESPNRPMASLKATGWFMSPALQWTVRNPAWSLTTLPFVDIPRLPFSDTDLQPLCCILFNSCCLSSRSNLLQMGRTPAEIYMARLINCAAMLLWGLTQPQCSLRGNPVNSRLSVGIWPDF